MPISSKIIGRPQVRNRLGYKLADSTDPKALQSSNNIGYTRANLELGRVLLSLGRARDAVAVLAPALRGDLQASNYYVTHTELHEALGQAFAAAGDADSARLHFAWVARAWQRADPVFRDRAHRARTESAGRR